MCRTLEVELYRRNSVFFVFVLYVYFKNRQIDGLNCVKCVYHHHQSDRQKIIRTQVAMYQNREFGSPVRI